MAFTKITNADLLNKGVVGLPDTPNLSTTEMQEKFDEIAKDVIVPKHNALIDELADIGAALNIGAVDPLGNPSTVQEQLNRQSESGYTKAEADMKFVAQEVGKQLSTEDFTTAEKDKLANLENYVLPIGTDTTLGGVKADNTTFTIDSNGVGHAIGGGGGGGTTDYNALINKPKINNVEVIGDKSLDDFGIAKNTLVEITVTYDTPVIGATITCENNTEVYTFTADSSLSHTFMCKSLGTWTVSEDAQGTSVEVNAVYYGRYSCVVGGDIAIVVNFGADMVGQTITCTKDGFSKSKTASGSSISFALADEGTYTISETLNSTSSTVTVTHGNTYTVDFKASIQVSIPDTDIGNTITCSDGTHTYTWVSDSTTHTFEVSKFGDWSVANTTIGVTHIVTVSAYTEYEVVIGGASIELTVTADFIGETITCSNNGTTKTWICDSTTHTFAVGLGTWTISSVVSGTTYSTSVVVTEYTTYTASLTMASYQGWLDSAGITTQYASLAEVLADEKTVRTLFTKHASVDYLVSWAQIDNVSATTILNDNYCAKWINLRDYALDTLYADTTCSALMDSADKYFYGEWVEKDGVWQAKGNVPIMTSNSAPYGVASAYQVFDGNASTSASGTDFSYQFVNPISIKKFESDVADGTLQVSDNGTTWITNDNGYHLYARVHYASSKTVHTIQFYGRELKVSVPTMTGNSAPWGSTNHYQVFDGSTSTSASDTDFTYDFGNSVVPKYFTSSTNGGTLQGSNDGVQWTDITPSGNTSAYSKLRVHYSASTSVHTVQFYGLDYSEHTERHYIYDHGVEVEAVETNMGGASAPIGTATKYGDNITLYRNGSSNTAWQEMVTTNAIDCTPYKLLRAVCLNLQSTLSSRYGTIGVVNTKSARAANGVATSDVYNNIPRHINIDVSNVNAQIYPKIDLYIANTSSYMQNLEINEMWLE